VTGLDEPRDLDGLMPAPMLGAGTILVLETVGGTRQPAVDAGIQSVLETQTGHRLELMTTADGAQAATADGAYVRPEDWSALGGASAGAAKLRRYSADDRQRKKWSRRGLAVRLPVAIGLLLAAVTVYFLIFGQEPRTGKEVAADARAALSWASEPLRALPANAGAAAVTAARTEAEQRWTTADRCLELIGGEKVDGATVPKVECKKAGADFWRDPANSKWIAGVLGLVTAAVAAFAARGKFGFGQEP
jgi:hypothetical protein